MCGLVIDFCKQTLRFFGLSITAKQEGVVHLTCPIRRIYIFTIPACPSPQYIQHIGFLDLVYPFGFLILWEHYCEKLFEDYIIAGDVEIAIIVRYKPNLVQGSLDFVRG